MAKGEVTREDDEDLFLEVLGRATGAIQGQDIPHVVFGSIASAEYGRPGATGDIDILIRPPDGIERSRRWAGRVSTRKPRIRPGSTRRSWTASWSM